MDIEDLAERLKDGFRDTVRHSENGENGPLKDPDFWKNYAHWWNENGKCYPRGTESRRHGHCS